jgi:hypothetical protein
MRYSIIPFAITLFFLPRLFIHEMYLGYIAHKLRLTSGLNRDNFA